MATANVFDVHVQPPVSELYSLSGVPPGFGFDYVSTEC